MDSKSSRPYYVVVDAGGWFKSKHFLLPVGHTRFDADEEVLVTELSRERIDRFPGFDKDNFEKLSDEDWKRFNDETCQACTVTGVSVVYAANEPYAAAWERADYSYPDWWRASPTLPNRMGESAVTAGAEYPPAASTPTAAPFEPRPHRRARRRRDRPARGRSEPALRRACAAGRCARRRDRGRAHPHRGHRRGREQTATGRGGDRPAIERLRPAWAHEHRRFGDRQSF